jgi:hypothetical protein
LRPNDKRPTMLELAWKFPKPRRGIEKEHWTPVKLYSLNIC